MTYFRLLSIVLLILYASNLLAQEDVLRPKNKIKGRKMFKESNINDSKIRFAFEFGSNFDWFSQSLSWNPNVPQSVLNVYESGLGRDNYFALLVDLPLNDILGFQAKLAYEGHTYKNDYTGIMDCFIAETGLYTNAEVANELEVSGADLGLSALIRYNIEKDLVLTAGPMILIPMGKYDQKLTQTINTEECYWDYGLPSQRKVNVVNSEIDNINSRFGLDIGIAYYLTLVENIQVAPQIRINYMFSKISDDSELEDLTRANNVGIGTLAGENAALHSLKFGIGIWF